MQKLLNIRSLLGGGAIAIALAAAAPAGAETAPAVDFTAGNNVSPSAGFSLGYQFTANTRVGVVGLATWDEWVTTPGSAVVGLWNAAGTLLATATVTATSPTIGMADWSYTPIRPVALTAGATYTVASYSVDTDYSYFNGGFTVDPRIAFVEDAWINSSSLQFPAATSFINEFEGGGYFGGNVILGPVPEPSTWAMTLAGFAGLALASYLAAHRGAAMAG